MRHRHCLGAGKRAFATRGLIDDGAERKQIALLAVFAAAQRLGCRVAWGAQELTLLGEVGVGYASDAEVRELHLPVLGDQQILGLEIPMNHTGKVCRRKRIADVLGQVEQIVS